MKNKIEELFKRSTESINELQILKRQLKKNYLTVNQQDLVLAKESNDLKTIKSVFDSYGKHAALNAKFGSFDRFRKALQMPATDTVSLYSYFFSKKENNKLIICIPDNQLRISFPRQIKIGERTLNIQNQIDLTTYMKEKVQIGRQVTKEDFIQKVVFPIRVIKLSFIEILNQTNSPDLHSLILDSYSQRYGEKSVSGIFTKSLQESNLDTVGQDIPEDPSLLELLSYQRERINL
jgi:hypothetical protein